MLKNVLLYTFFGFMLLMASSSYAAVDQDSLALGKITMGGSIAGTRNSTKQDAEVTWNAAMGDLLSPYGTHLSILVYHNSEDLLAAFDKGEINGIFGTPLEFLAREDQLGKSLMAVHYKNVPLKQSLVVLVRKGDGITQLSDLKNKRISLPFFEGTETLYLNTLLLKSRLQETPDFFSEHFDAKNSNVAIMDVFFNKADITIVRENEFNIANELNPQVGKKLLVLAKSPPYISVLGGARKEFSSDALLDLLKALQKIANTERGKQLLNLIQAESLDLITPDELQSVRDLKKEYQSLKQLNNQNAPMKISTVKVKRNAQ